jgi:hypothetical protein
MPFSSVRGPAPAAVGWAAGIAAGYTAAGRASGTRDGAFGVMNGIFLSAVLAHFIYWPTRRIVGVPWLTECEGLRGKVIAPYNVILYTSGVAAVAGLTENGRAGRRGALVPLILVPILLVIQDVEFARLEQQAQQRPAWWNRRLQH